MNQVLLGVLSAAFGAVFGCAVARMSFTGQPSPSERIETRELVVLDEHRKAAATLGSIDGRTVLRFLDSNSRVQLEVGLQSARGERFVRMYGRDGRVLAALNSSTPNGETTLYLGDERWASRVVLGALRTDMEDGALGIEDWGLQFRRPGASGSLFSVLVKSASDPRSAEAHLRLARPDGTEWVR